MPEVTNAEATDWARAFDTVLLTAAEPTRSEKPATIIFLPGAVLIHSTAS